MNIINLISRFRGLEKERELIKIETANCINQHIPEAVITEDIIPGQKGTIKLKSSISSSLRSEIHLRKTSILECLDKKLGSLAPKDIRF